MIISGGTQNETTVALGEVSQTFSLDLTVPWDTSSPKYNMLPDGPADLYVPSSRSGDDSLVVISNSQVFSFSLSSPPTWTTVSNLSNGIASKSTRLGGAIDPATNTFYVPGGYRQAGANNTMMAYNLAHGTTTSLPMPSDLPADIEAGVAWSAYAKRLFLQGGRVSGSTSTPWGGFYSFNPADSTWIQPTVGGNSPSARRNHCLVSDATGSRLVVFGGINELVQPLSDIYVLDVTTMVWKKGPDASSSVARGASSCGIDHDLLIVWGGGHGSMAVTKNITLLFNLQTMQWVNQFAPATTSVTPNGGNSTGDGSSPGKSSASSNGAIIGGAVGGVAAIVLVIGFFMYRRRRAQSAFLNKKEGEGLHHQTEGYVPPPPSGYVPPPPSVPLHLNESYHDRHPHQSVPTATQQGLSPQLWGGKDRGSPQTSAHDISAESYHDRNPHQSVPTTKQPGQSPQLWGGKDGRPPQTSAYDMSASKEPLQPSAPQSYEAAVNGLIQPDAPANGPHAVLS
ncbi:hypothetical protein BGZ83_006342 [Gryganskiella cystojenkinii]|nr:hypothetical protein BGZ83_006342 [Gryganskiella cystojenkinii]